MHLERLSLSNFRIYDQVDLSFDDGIHVIYGDNGSGKTTILEAIHYLALTKSFRTKTDKHLILNQQDMFRIQGEFRSEAGQKLKSALAYTSSTGKQLSINGQKANRFSEYIGSVPVVLLHPADLSLSQGSPLQRRRFLDILLSQSSKLYMHHLIEYNRSLRQRNQQLQLASSNPQLLIPWEENLVRNGVELIQKRRETIEKLDALVKHYYGQLSENDDSVKIIYQTNVQQKGEDDLANIYRRLFEQKRPRERDTGSTELGPHRDDMLFLINGKPMKAYASQGEHKTLVIALKLAEFDYLQLQQMQPPILLFDDIFGELDANRIRMMLQQLSNIGQVFVTTTSRTFFDKVQGFDAPTHYYFVENGKIASLAS